MRISDWSSDVCSSDLLGYAANEAEFADAQASRMVQYATDAQIEEAIDNGGVMDGVQIAPGVLTQEKTRRVQAAIDQAEITEFETTPLQAAKNAYRSEEHTSELQSLMRISYAVFCLKKKQ